MNRRRCFPISIHAPAGGATLGLLLERNEVILFQFTPLREGRQKIAAVEVTTEIYFNSRPCGRGDAVLGGLIHAPAISIHAPAGGATETAEASPARLTDFNSRPCGRGDWAVST